MRKQTRFSISLDSELLLHFDSLCEQRGYLTRSEAIRDLLRNTLVEQEWSGSTQDMAATLTLIYERRKAALAQKVAANQQNAHHLIIATQHIQFVPNNSLEILLLKGPWPELQSLAEHLVSIRGIKYGRLTQVTRV